ncbi:calcium-regulated heat-stable protein 1 isoform X1 [Prinia subflava]|uniref:calcium-regulated heat-stable protein 1 isoform X1 n=1 Tax=Prinia subflava TaxID=208062 RepID=UPI002FE41A1C
MPSSPEHRFHSTAVVSFSGRRSRARRPRTSRGAVGEPGTPGGAERGRAGRRGTGRNGAPRTCPPLLSPALPSPKRGGAGLSSLPLPSPSLPSPAQRRGQPDSSPGAGPPARPAQPCPAQPCPGSPQASGMSSEPASSSSQPCPASPPSPSSLHLPEGRRPRERSPSPMRGYLIPSPLPTRRTRTFSATVRASEGPIYKGVCKCFCRSKGHGFITPADGGPDIFVHISDIEGEYVPVAGDEVTYKMCTIPPKNEKLQAVEVVITHLAPGTKHETWSGHVISS